jgi:hypothetical protein
VVRHDPDAVVLQELRPVYAVSAPVRAVWASLRSAPVPRCSAGRDIAVSATAGSLAATAASLAATASEMLVPAVLVIHRMLTASQSLMGQPG